MFEKFVRATVQTIPNSYKLIYSCINGAPAADQSLTVPQTERYADGSEFADGDVLMFSLAADDSLLPGFYPFKDPEGNPINFNGGKGKGVINDIEQRQSAPVGALKQRSSAAASPAPAADTIPLQVHWINGIWMSETITMVLDPGYASLPSGTEVFFQCSYDSDNNLQADYVAVSEGDCGNPA
jgi:hypothetical protein